jgi:hypothetical protein
VVVAAIAVAGCGSSSKSSTSAKAPTPATPSTPATTGTGTTTSPVAGAAPSDALTGAPAKAALVKAAGKIGASSADATKFVECVIPKLEAKGVKTIADFEKAPQSEITAAAKACNSELGLHLRYQDF